jgi:N-acetylglutamate synthase-like GNAT family acetyltransferase
MTVVRRATATDWERVRAGYEAWSYQGGAAPADTIYLAERDGTLLGFVRRTMEHDTVMLRGMRVVPDEQRQGIGIRILRYFVSQLGDAECWCVPFTHLTGFYGAVGFEVVPESESPKFLQERVALYRQRGDDMLIMRRPSTPSR